MWWYKYSKAFALGLSVVMACQPNAPKGEKIAPFMDSITQISKKYQCEIGFSALLLKNGQIVNLGSDNKKKFKTFSVYKMLLAAKILDLVSQNKLALDSQICVTKKNLRDYGNKSFIQSKSGDKICESLSNILRYTVGYSDNNTTDILMELAGQADSMIAFEKAQGFKQLSINDDNPENKGTAWVVRHEIHPDEMCLWLNKLYHHKILTPALCDTLLQIMKETPGGLNRLRGKLDPNTVVAHKTGTGNTENGIIEALNDVGIVYRSDGNDYVISVFIVESKESEEATAEIIAEINRLVFTYFK